VNPNKTSQGKCRGPNRKIGGETKRKRIFFCLWDLRDEFLTGTMMTIRTCFSDLSFYLFFFFFVCFVWLISSLEMSTNSSSSSWTVPLFNWLL
jgi:hypothetical protein